jgi:hypothetical protein
MAGGIICEIGFCFDDGATRPLACGRATQKEMSEQAGSHEFRRGFEK